MDINYGSKYLARCGSSQFTMMDSESLAVNLAGIEKQFVDLSGHRTVLTDLDLAIAGGEFVSITGPSGSGKSTLLNILGGIDLPDAGSVQIGGEHLELKSESERTVFRRHYIGFVFQFFNLIPTLTVEENLRLPLELSKKSYEPQLIQQWLDRFCLGSRADSYPGVLSGGEQQRVAIIRAAIHSPRLILADEPTGNLDKVAGAETLDVLVEIAGRGTSVVMATHSEIAAARADRQLILRDGKLVTQYSG